MTLKEQILNDIKEAMKQKNDFKRDVLRTLNAALKQVEIDQRIILDDEKIFKIIIGEIKKRKDAADIYIKGKREDLAQKENDEIAILEIYLPKQLSDEELKSSLKKIIEKLGVNSLKEQGLVMKEAKEEFGARVDGKRLNEALRAILS
ncbi:GatB/YqeY domain-containing protein [Campylobacter sp. RM10532]|uniref:GatB/YqeY domain-containing protein n=1 Tax=Campylobacter molothri TaxID=1032242 RepID=A0ACC5W0H5_9BACT|nr:MULTISPECIES: GatB/YqeY domain-containing protein [unclassified Campylobacter]MBZ7928428.1 GatB/YqeY domain-containing protein [Campylobacter sp. RM10542]MBZ7931537.1 GatB/YqeY domain-containing protein [Campylobacter sp. RM12910]MBZ7937231.1 GatB/YqeY domain-containing protein [Campylobacter sp. RM10538]MBZ7940617.1 GatB/YqeY domain-containing protein [Campylobacter sp. W0047]MBZ7943488.1 GatB/YqeY domain-containing protein [Campylobacter sp. RM13744]MBZ7944699.1 GatB/YqeY domain-containi